MLHSNIHGNLGKMTADQIVQCGRAIHLNFLRVCVSFHRQKRNVQSCPRFEKRYKFWLSDAEGNSGKQYLTKII